MVVLDVALVVGALIRDGMLSSVRLETNYMK